MKLCTLLKFNGEQPPEISFSLVNDDHQFGWIDGKLHLEGKVEIKERQETNETENPLS